MKKEEFKTIKLKYSLLEKAMSRKNSTKKGRSHKIYFPILAVNCEPHMKIELE
jgi:hypothetical protein